MLRFVAQCWNLYTVMCVSMAVCARGCVCLCVAVVEVEGGVAVHCQPNGSMIRVLSALAFFHAVHHCSILSCYTDGLKRKCRGNSTLVACAVIYTW